MKVQREDFLYKLIYICWVYPRFLFNFNFNLFCSRCELKLVQIYRYINYYAVLGYSDLFPCRAWWWHVNEPTFLIPLLRHDTCVVRSVIWYPILINQSINQSVNHSITFIYFILFFYGFNPQQKSCPRMFCFEKLYRKWDCLQYSSL